MSDINPFSQPPLWEGSQVLTETDLIGIRNGFVLQLTQVPWYYFETRRKFMYMVITADLLLAWLHNNKPSYYKGIFDADTGEIK